MQMPAVPPVARSPVRVVAPLRRRCGAALWSGFSLIEALVALVLLAIGLLGMATLLLESVSGSRIALERTRAVALASDMIERIRVNRGAGEAYDTADGANAAALDPGCEQADGGCSAEAMASHDLRRWLDSIAEQLPLGLGSVDVVRLAQGGLHCTVTIAWARSDSLQPAAYTLETEL